MTAKENPVKQRSFCFCGFSVLEVRCHASNTHKKKREKIIKIIMLVSIVTSSTYQSNSLLQYKCLNASKERLLLPRRNRKCVEMAIQVPAHVLM